MAIYFASHGLSLSAISLLFLIWSCTSIILEVPTGILGDRYNRKTVLVIAQSAKLLGFIVWILLPSFVGFLIGLILWGVAASLDSGTFQAFLYDTADGGKNKKIFNNLYGKAMSASFAGLFTATVLASFLVQFGFFYLLVLSIIGLSVSLITLLFVPSAPRGEAETVLPTLSYKTMFHNIGLMWSNKALLAFMVIGVSAAGMKAPLDEYHALLFEDRGISLAIIGLIVASLELVKSLGSFMASKVHLEDYRQNILLASIGAMLIGIAFVPVYVAILLLVAIILLDMVLWIQNDIAIQHLAGNHNRATLLSLKMFIGEITAAGMFAIFGVVARHFNISGLYLLSGMLLVLISFSLLLRFNVREIKFASQEKV